MNPRTRRCLTVLLSALLVLLASGTVVSNAAEGSVTLLGNTGITLTLPRGERELTFQVKALNDSHAPQDIYLDVVGLPPNVTGDLPLVQEFVPRGEVLFDITLTWAAGVSPRYAGQIVVYGEDLVPAYRDVELIIEDAWWPQVPAGEADAVTAPTIGFLGTRQVQVSLPYYRDDIDSQVKVRNLSNIPQKIHLEVIGLSPRLLADVRYLSQESETEVQRGQVVAFDLRFTRGMTGTHSGELVAYGDVGGQSTLPLTLTIEEPPERDALLGPAAWLDRNVTHTLWTWIRQLALLAAVPLVLLLALRLVQLALPAFRRRQVIIGDLVNASGEGSLDNVLPGLGQTARELMAHQLANLQSAYRPSRSPISRRVLASRLGEMRSSISEGTTQGGPIVQAVKALYPQAGDQVKGVLQREGDAVQRLGISWSVSDLRGRQTPIRGTVWEAQRPPTEVPDEPSDEQPLRSAALAALDEPEAGETGTLEADSPPPEAHAYYRVARFLAGPPLGMYREAMSYLREALDLHVEFNLAAKELASAVSSLQVQEKAGSTFAMGEELRSAGLVDQAIRSYKKLLDPDKQQTAEKAWNVVLGITSGEKAAEYLNLARLYGEVLLYVESLSLYQAAVVEGSKEAASELRKIQQAAAARLTEAGKRLCVLAHYDTAEEYLREALVRLPGYQRAINQLAIVEQNRPPREDDELLAQLRLGSLYEERGALEQAIPHYEAALKRDPQDPDARVALARVMDAWQSTHERYSRLLGPASLWLGLQITRRQLLARVPLRYRVRRRRYAGQVHNTIGLLAQTHARTFPGYETQFSHMAVQELRTATALWPRHWLPWSNLADAQRQMSQALRPTSPDESLFWHEGAIASYNRALELARKPNEQREVRAAMAIAYLIQDDRARAEELIAEVEPGEATWGIATAAENGLLLNLATYYTLASRTEGTAGDPGRKARRYLALSLARDAKRVNWGWIERAPEFAPLGQGLDRVKDEIAFEQARNRKLHRVADLSGLILGTSHGAGVLDRCGWSGAAPPATSSPETDGA